MRASIKRAPAMAEQSSEGRRAGATSAARLIGTGTCRRRGDPCPGHLCSNSDHPQLREGSAPRSPDSSLPESTGYRQHPLQPLRGDCCAHSGDPTLTPASAMEHRSSVQLLLSFALFSFLYFRAHALPALGTYSAMRLGNRIPFDGANEADQAPGSLKADADILQNTLPENDKLYLDMSRAIGRNSRHADGLFTSGYSKLLGQLSARRYLESLIGKRVSSNALEDQMPIKRHSDAVFTDNYSRFRKQMAVKKYLNSVLTGKRSPEDINPANLRDDTDLSEPPFSENYDDVTVDDLLNHLPLNL